MAQIWCPKCSNWSSASSWERKTRNYSEENDRRAGYGNSSGTMICPNCGNEVDADNVDIED